METERRHTLQLHSSSGKHPHFSSYYRWWDNRRIVRLPLTRIEIDCVMIDRGLIGAGGTGAAPGILQYDSGISLQRLKEQFGNAKADRFFHLSVNAICRLREISTHIGFTDLQSRPGLYLAPFKKDFPFLKQEFDSRRSAGLDVDWLDAADLQTGFGINGYGAIYSGIAGQVKNLYLSTN